MRHACWEIRLYIIYPWLFRAFDLSNKSQVILLLDASEVSFSENRGLRQQKQWGRDIPGRGLGMSAESAS